MPTESQSERNAGQNNLLPEAQAIKVADLVAVYGKSGCQEILSLFVPEVTGLLQQAAAFIVQQQSKELSRIGHQLKGLGAFVICPYMETLGRQLETSAQQCDWQEAKQCYSLLEGWLSGVTVFINQLLPSLAE